MPAKLTSRRRNGERLQDCTTQSVRSRTVQMSMLGCWYCRDDRVYLAHTPTHHHYPLDLHQSHHHQASPFSFLTRHSLSPRRHQSSNLQTFPSPRHRFRGSLQLILPSYSSRVYTLPSSFNMRAFALLATLFAVILGNASALTDAGKMTTVTAKAVASDERTDDSGCTPDGCLPENTRDGSRDANSRWSCVGTMITGVGGCRIQYTFEDPQDIVKVRIAFHKGDENVRVLNVYVDGSYHSQITSSGEKLGYQNFLLNTSQTSKVIFRLADHADKLDEWLSITEIKFMV